MNDEKSMEMEVFRAGDYGAKGRYSEADLQAMAEDYRPDLLEAPLTFDHAQSGPAYGWVARLRRQGDRLVAALAGVPDAVRELVRTGAFKHRSVELLRVLPETGRPYLRAVSLLGAATPHVKGLREIRFAADGAAERMVAGEAPEDGGEERTEGTWRADAAQKAGHIQPADSSELADSAKQSHLTDLSDPTDPSDLAGQGGQNALTAASLACAEAGCATVAADTANTTAALRAEVAALRRELRARAADGVFAELRSDRFCLSDRDEAALRHLTENAPDDRVVFSDSESAPLADWLRGFLRTTALRVPMGVCSGGRQPARLPAEFSARTDPGSVALHHRALAMQGEQPGLSYASAVSLASAR